MKTLIGNKRYLYAFSNLKSQISENLYPKDFHQYLKDKKMHLYIPDRGPSYFTNLYCQEIFGCVSYFYSNWTLLFFDIDHTKKIFIPSLKSFISGNCQTNFKGPLSVLEQMITSGTSCCIDYTTAKSIYNEILPYESLSKTECDLPSTFAGLLNIFKIGSSLDSIVIWTDDILD